LFKQENIPTMEKDININNPRSLKIKKYAHDAFREVAVLKKQTSFYIVTGLIILAAIGIISNLVKDPSGFIKMIVGTALIVAVIFFVIRRFSQASPAQNHEQRAFKKAAKRSKKRFQTKESTHSPKRSSVKSLSAARKKRDTSHLTVIEGKKGKKKNRASF